MSARDLPLHPIDVFELARSGGSVAGVAALARMARLLPSLADDAGELRFALRGFTDERGRPAAELELEGAVTLACDRCAKPVRHTLSSRARYYFVRSEQELARIAIDETAEEPLLGSARFDLQQLLEDEAILALPMSPRHSGCAPQPGRSAARESEPPGAPHPFAELARALKARRR